MGYVSSRECIIYIYIYLYMYVCRGMYTYMYIYLDTLPLLSHHLTQLQPAFFFNCLDCVFRQNLHIQKIRLGMSKPGRGPWPWPIFPSPFKWHKVLTKTNVVITLVEFFLGSLFIFHPQLGWLYIYIYHESFYANFFARIPLSLVPAASSRSFRICCPVES